MLKLFGLAAQIGLIALAGYNAVTAFWGWPPRTPAAKGRRDRRFRVLIPAHDEEAVISSLLEDLGKCDYQSQLVDVWVLADRCSDRTPEIARAHGAAVAARNTGSGGKGAAVAWYLKRHPLGTDESLVVIDADNRVPSELFARLSDEIDQGHQAVQCYLDVTDSEQSLIAEASALSYWASNRMVQLARSNLGWSADLGGTGMAITASALSEAGGFSDTLAEDQDLGIRLLLAGHRVEWLHDVKVEDEKPSGIGVAVRQRARWMAGKRSTRRRHLWSLLRLRTPSSLDMAVRLVQPSRTFVALLSGVLTVAAAGASSSWLLPWQVWGAVTAIQVLEPIPFLARDGVEAKRLIRYPLLVLLAGLWIPVRFMSGWVKGWYHTPHRGPTA